MALHHLFSKRWVYHLAFWIALILPFTLALGYQPGRNLIDSFLSIFLVSMVYMLVVYINILFLIPRYLQQQKILLYAVFLVLTILLTVPLHFLANVYLKGEIDSATAMGELLLSFTNVVVMLGLTTALKFAKQWFWGQQEKQELEKQRLQAELQFLRSQINPHFLFNTLNNLYALTLKKSDHAPEMVLKLSEMMRYFLYTSNEKTVPLEMEIASLNNYIDLEKLRQLHSTTITTHMPQQVNGISVAPLLFIPFLENSFKHGINNTIEGGWIDIHLSLEGSQLTYIVANSKPSKPINGKTHTAGGIGLANVKRRLDLLYPNKYALSVTDEDNIYRTKLKIDLS
ncbi:MAG: histidine kinase [Chitinophagales bacterium]|nr:histidine kinase [Chitinophagales bacterium]